MSKPLPPTPAGTPQEPPATHLPQHPRQDRDTPPTDPQHENLKQPDDDENDELRHESAV